jgi:putative spermidine/putrescine transport system permease protein
VGQVLERGDLVASTTAGGGLSLAGARRRLSVPFWRHRWLRTLAELVPPVGWMTLIYISAVVALFVYAFWGVDPFTGKVVHTWSLDNFRSIFESSAFRGVIWRTIWIAAAVTATCAVLAFPFAYFMARVASPRVRAMLFVLVLLPLWSSYLVRVYAWKVILAQDGILNWSLGKIGLPGANLGYSNTAMWLVFTYIWLPFMILPVYAALERIPHSYIEASRDLGAGGFTTLRRVILPLAMPGVVAGSIFTFSLTLGDYITPTLVGGAGSTFIGNIVYSTGLGVSGNLPFAAAFAAIPVVVMAIYLTLAKRTGAFEAL